MSNQAKIWKTVFSILLILSVSLAVYLFAAADSNVVSATQSQRCPTYSGSLSFPAGSDGIFHGVDLGFVTCHGTCNYGDGQSCGGGYNVFQIRRATWQAQSANTAYCAANSPGSCECSMCLSVAPE